MLTLKHVPKRPFSSMYVSGRYPKLKKQGQDLKFKQKRNQANPHRVDNMHIHEGRLSWSMGFCLGKRALLCSDQQQGNIPVGKTVYVTQQ